MIILVCILLYCIVLYVYNVKENIQYIYYIVVIVTHKRLFSVSGLLDCLDGAVVERAHWEREVAGSILYRESFKMVVMIFPPCRSILWVNITRYGCVTHYTNEIRSIFQ